ncbi:MAG: glycosyltransferase family 4 protein, partial [Phycisphaerales bacterium]|nr:glycosyltransferase family 4 protein [Phycisphaerales bacterium]
MIKAIVHLTDDESIGGISRMLSHINDCPELAACGHHHIVAVQRGQLSLPPIRADIIVSHLSISWANMPLLTELRARHPETRIIHIEHSYCERFLSANVSQRERFDTLLRAAYSLFDRVVCVSGPQHDWMLRKGYCEPLQLLCIPSCVDLSPFFGIDAPRPEGKVVIGALGRLSVQKGFDILLQAFWEAGRNDLELHIYGDGPSRLDLENIAANSDNVTFHGETDNPVAAIRACHAVAMPS